MRLAPALLLVFVLAACLPPSSALPDAPPGAPLAVIRVSGGIAGGDTTWTLRPDGAVIRAERNPPPGRTLDQRLPGGEAEARALADQLRQTGVMRIAAGRYGPETHCCDRQEYDLTIALDGKLQRTLTIDGSEAPKELLAARDAIIKAVRAAR